MRPALFNGFARKLIYPLGIVYGLFVWSVAEGFGGPYARGTTTDVGAAIVYSLVIWALGRRPALTSALRSRNSIWAAFRERDAADRSLPVDGRHF